MQRRKHKLSIAIPVSIISDIPHLREKTLEIGLIGRAAAIFRVNEIVVFSDNANDPNQKWDKKLIVTLLSYMEAPQYLRKRLFKIKPELRYAGILPPLRTPHHPLEKRAKKLKVGEYREGAITAVTDEGSLVNIGVERSILILGKKLALNKRVTVKVTKSGKSPEVVLASRKEIKAYWGYTVNSTDDSFGKLTKAHHYDLVIATSKLGAPIMQVYDELAESWKKSGKILVAFGAPAHGLQEILKQENTSLDKVADFTINTIPEQGTETVRTEEALYVSLALLNTL
ncbi:MAG: RNA methyltransferase [Candidatus Bathyarchaeota archaeon]|nr:RNA methyltransferase [Candidatus Bathyarchaeum sp.]